MSTQHDDKAGLFSLLPPAEREDIYWRIAEGLGELYGSLTQAWDDLQSLEIELSMIFRGECDLR